MNLDTPGDTIIMGTKGSVRVPSTECWNGSIGGGAGHIAISLGDGRMVTTTRGAVDIRAIRGFAASAYLGWMPPYFTST